MISTIKKNKEAIAKVLQISPINTSVIKDNAKDTNKSYSTVIRLWLDTTEYKATSLKYWQSLADTLRVHSLANQIKDSLSENFTLQTENQDLTIRARSITVLREDNKRIRFTVSILGGDLYVSVRNLDSTLQSTHSISRFTTYYLTRSINTI